MRRVRGLGGRVFLASDRLPFIAEPLDDAGDGFDWRLRDRAKRFWCEEPLLFEACAAGGDWTPIAADEVLHLTGRVGFTRCLRGQQVRATGSCRPLVEAILSEEWDLRVEAPLADTTTLDDDTATHQGVRERTAIAVLTGCAVDEFLASSLEQGGLLVHLPFRKGVFAGVGVRQVAPDTGDVHIRFDEGKVRYVQS